MSPRRPQTCLTLAGIALFTCLFAAVPETQGQTARPFDSITTQRLTERAREAFASEDFVLAVELYQEILIREPANIEAIVELANVYERDGKLEYAQGLLFRAERLSPNDPSIRKRRANVEQLLTAVLSEEVESLMVRGQYDLAIPKLGLHLTLEPQNSKLLYQRATCFLQKGQLGSALADAQRAISLTPEPEYYDLRRRIVEEKQRVELASHMERARPLTTSTHPEDHKEVKILLGEILQLDPENEWAKTELARITPKMPSGEPTVAAAESSDTTDAAAAYAAKLEEKARNDAKKRASRAALAAQAREIADEMKGAAGGISPTIIAAIALLIFAWLAFRSPLARTIARMFDRTPLLSGRLSDFHLNEVLLLIAAEPRSGVLNVKGKRGECRLYFANGEPCHCVAGKLDGIAALTLLLDNPSDGTFNFVTATIPLKNTIDTPLSLILAERSRSRAAQKEDAPGEPGSKKSRIKELLESR